MTWYAVDTDPIAVACLAVNTVLWGLGTRVVLGVGNSLHDDWLTPALAQRNEAIELAETLRQSKRLLDELMTTFG